MSTKGSIKNGKGSYDSLAINNADNKEDNGEIKLEAKMSLLNGITVIVGSIIGSGIFVSPTGVIMHTGSTNVALIVWTASGIFSMVRTPMKIIYKNTSVNVVDIKFKIVNKSIK